MQNNIQTQALNLALARKWRPQTFTQITGQDVVVKALSNALDTNRLHHAYLFTGTRGVGKTTLSRLLAKALSCDKGISSNPCCICSNCISMQNAQYIDYIELDAASNRGVEEISKLLENASYQPSQGRFKIFMIDEVHMLSNHAFNAMLKTLEEPPAHVKFILATTDAHKIPMTVLSRCLQFHLRPLSNSNIIEYLKYILQQEEVNFEEPCLAYIAKAARGSMRDALSITDQAIALGHGEIKAYETKQMLGLVNDDLPITLLFNILKGDIVSVLSLLEQVQNADKFLDSLIIHLQNIAIIQCLESAIIDTDYPSEINKLAKLISAENIQIYYQMVIKSKQEINFCPAEVVISMLCMRIMYFQMPIDKSKSINIKNHIDTNKNIEINPATNTNNNQSINEPNIVNNKDNSNTNISSIRSITSNIQLPNNNQYEVKATATTKATVKTNIKDENQKFDNLQNSLHDISIINNDVSSDIPVKNTLQNKLDNIDISNIKSGTNINILEDVNNNSDILNNEKWLNIVPQLKLNGLALQIAKQSILYKDDGKIIYLNCEFDTGFMKNAVAKLQSILSGYLKKEIALNIFSNQGALVNFNSLITNNIYANTVATAISNNININPPEEINSDIHLDNDKTNKTLLKQEQDEKQQYTQKQLQKAEQDPWVNEFIQIGSKIII